MNSVPLAPIQAPKSFARGKARLNFRPQRSARRAMPQIGLVAGKEFSDRLRSGWVIACVVLWLGAIALTSLFGLLQIGQIGWQGYERTVISLLNLVQYLVPLLGLLLGHDLIVSEREERTLPLLIASGVSRSQLLIGKFAGGCLTLAVPLILGFVISGTAIGLGTNDSAVKPFLILAASGLVLGFVFLAIGLLVSSVSRTRVQSLVLALLAWCTAVFVFDLVALGIVISTKAPQAALEIDAACDATHLNSAVDIHSAFDTPQKHEDTVTKRKTAFSWLLLNPVDLFRTINLSTQTQITVPIPAVLSTVFLWLGVCLAFSNWRLSRIDL